MGRLFGFVGAAAIAVMGSAVSARADVTISAAATQNMTCSAGVCAPTSANAVLNANDLLVAGVRKCEGHDDGFGRAGG